MAVPSDDPRRQALLDMDIMQVGYIEDLGSNREAIEVENPFENDEPDLTGASHERGAWDGSSGWDDPMPQPMREAVSSPIPDNAHAHGSMPNSTAEPPYDQTRSSEDDKAEEDWSDLTAINPNDLGSDFASGFDDATRGDAASQPEPPAPAPPAHAPNESRHHDEPPRHDGRRHGKRRHGRIVRALKRVLAVVLVIALLAAGFIAGMMYEQHRNPSISAAVIETQLAECSDLATAKMHYNGLVRYESGDIPLINKKTFGMTYQAEVRAGIDLSQAQVSVANDVIRVKLPKATVQTTAIDPSSVKFFDQTWGLFNWESKDDAKTALEQAQRDLEEGLDDNRMIEEANLNAKEVVNGLIAPTLKMNSDYRLEIETE